MSTIILHAFLLLAHSNQPSRTYAFLHPNLIAQGKSTKRIGSTKVWYVNEKEPISIVQEELLNSNDTNGIPSMPWDNEIATQQIGDLEDLFNSESKTDDYGFTEVMQPSEMITHEHKHLIFRPATQESMTLSPSNAGTSPAKKQQQEALALVLLPGCFLEPIEYKALALAVQKQSTRPTWVAIPKLVLNAALSMDSFTCHQRVYQRNEFVGLSI